VSQRNLMILAFLFLFIFLGILLWNLPRLDLGGVIVLTLLLAAYDIYASDHFSGKR
jgi:hypothetical protein